MQITCAVAMHDCGHGSSVAQPNATRIDSTLLMAGQGPGLITSVEQEICMYANMMHVGN